MRTPIASPTVFFFNDTATTEIYTLSLHDALPISFDIRQRAAQGRGKRRRVRRGGSRGTVVPFRTAPPESLPKGRSEEHTSELQSQSNLVCRLLLEKKNKHLIQTTAVYPYTAVAHR